MISFERRQFVANSSAASMASVPEPTKNAFTGGDAGVHTFSNGVTLKTADALLILEWHLRQSQTISADGACLRRVLQPTRSRACSAKASSSARPVGTDDERGRSRGGQTLNAFKGPSSAGACSPLARSKRTN